MLSLARAGAFPAAVRERAAVAVAGRASGQFVQHACRSRDA